MSEEYNMGDVIRLTNTRQEGEVLEVVNVGTDEHHGALLRVNLLGVKPPMIVYYPVRAVQLVRPAASNQGKKQGHDKKTEPADKPEQSKKTEPADKPEHGEKSHRHS